LYPGGKPEKCIAETITEAIVMISNMKTFLFVVAVILLCIGTPLLAEEKKPFVNASDGIREILTSNMGKRITVKTDSGEAIEGTVVMVGNHWCILKN
jgi:hypothetical protein